MNRMTPRAKAWIATLSAFSFLSWAVAGWFGIAMFVAGLTIHLTVAYCRRSRG